MGREKGPLVHPDGRTLARRGYDLLLEAGCERVALGLREGQEIPAGFDGVGEIWTASDPGTGPMAGIVAVMRLQPDADWLVIACDLPRLDRPTLERLAAETRPDEKFLAYRNPHDGKPEPLCAIYTHAALADLENALAAGEKSPRDFLARHGCRLIDPPDAGALENANTPADGEQAIAAPPDWHAELCEIWISPGNNFRGRHERGSLDHGIIGLREIECVAGLGLRGDRYFGYKPDFKGQVTFFDAATVDAVRAEFALPELSSSVFRRNLIVRGVDLGEWAGKKFRFQGVEFEGSEECRPCYWMDQAAAPGAEAFLAANFRGGLRARILSGGILRVGGWER